MKKLIIAAVAALVVAGGAVGILATQNEPKQTQQSTQTQTQTKTQTTQTEQTQQTEVTYKGVEGKNALELLKQSHEVETKSYEGLGELVTSIDGVAADSKHFWALYVNGQQSQVGAAAYISKDTDTIVWKLEEIK